MEGTASSVNAEPGQRSHLNGGFTQWRSWSGFWLLGLCNNFAYVVMLSAAHDILKKQQSENSTSTLATLTVDFQGGNSSNSSRYDCNPVSTAAVLLADILPTLVIKLCAPFVIHKMPYGIRVLFCVIMAATSFLLVSFSSAVWMSILGVIFASISSGLGELSFLALTVFFSRDVLGGWGSGTGGAGVAGAFLYSGLTQVGLSPQVTLLIMLVVPFVMLISYFFWLNHPPSLPQWKSRETEYAAGGSEERRQLMEGSEEEDEQERLTPESDRCLNPPNELDRSTGCLTFTEKLCIIKGLLKFVFPLGLVYFAEYFINQGLMELLYFPNFFLSHAEQYRWYQTLYQIGVLVSRSSLCCVKIRKLWVLSLLQVLNAVLLLFAVRYQFLPSAWLVFVIILYEGLLGGAAYVNTFYFISMEMEDRHREFAMAAASVGDSLGIALAGLIAFPVHKYFCNL
ncbi:battenin [Anabas testudineus]|uniref:Battenin n=1 Tax=Anabas testudineus TaxID=64144 RepID=A0A3Q1I6S9_ANATE|nr:battenin [Anabas testudineus]XP_026215301.1 battenin [Anabas testudineus]